MDAFGELMKPRSIRGNELEPFTKQIRIKSIEGSAVIKMDPVHPFLHDWDSIGHRDVSFFSH